MKNYQYLTDGLLESYPLGTLSQENREQARQLIATDTDLASELEELELEMEQYFMQHAVSPPHSITTALQQRLGGSALQKWTEPYEPFTREAPQPEPNRSPYVDVEVSDTHLRVHKNWRTALIMIFVLGKIFLAFGLYHYFRANSLAQEVERLRAPQQTTSPAPQGQR